MATLMSSFARPVPHEGCPIDHTSPARHHHTFDAAPAPLVGRWPADPRAR
jgi:hypothetical protein